VVNVILVDFRAFDTLGEIFVVAAVALTAYALLRRFRPAPDSIAVPDQQASADGTTAGTAVTARGEAPGRRLAAGALHPHAAGLSRPC
jgi:multicomponent K+:H+ antiporter subunit A